MLPPCARGVERAVAARYYRTGLYFGYSARDVRAQRASRRAAGLPAVRGIRAPEAGPPVSFCRRCCVRDELPAGGGAELKADGRPRSLGLCESRETAPRAITAQDAVRQ